MRHHGRLDDEALALRHGPHAQTGAASVNVSFGHDSVMDPRYGMGSADMLEVAHMAFHVAQTTSQKGIWQCFVHLLYLEEARCQFLDLHICSVNITQRKFSCWIFERIPH